MARADQLDEALAALLAAEPGDAAARPPAIEALLTEGYARALELEAERLRLLERTGERTALSDYLARLRSQLDEINRRHRPSGKLHLDRRPSARGGPDQELAS
jgi:hypothetical protein